MKKARDISPVDNPNSRAYLECMEELRDRLNTVMWLSYGAQVLKVRPQVWSETQMLQLRMSLELIAFGSLVANQAGYAGKRDSFDTDWKAEKILGVLPGINPHFYPVPVKAATLLRRCGVPFNTLSCVHRHSATRPLDVYRFLRREIGSTYLQFIPIVEIRDFETIAPHAWNASRLPIVGTPESRPGRPHSVVTEWSVDPEEYGYFLCKIWDEWLSRDFGKVLVNFCETLVAQHMGQPSQLCVHSEVCGKGLAIEHDGGVYACDHYVYPEYRRGHLRSRDLGKMVFDPEQVRFGYAKSEKLPTCCRECPYLSGLIPC